MRIRTGGKAVALFAALAMIAAACGDDDDTVEPEETVEEEEVEEPEEEEVEEPEEEVEEEEEAAPTGMEFVEAGESIAYQSAAGDALAFMEVREGSGEPSRGAYDVSRWVDGEFTLLDVVTGTVG